MEKKEEEPQQQQHTEEDQNHSVLKTIDVRNFIYLLISPLTGDIYFNFVINILFS